MESDVEYEQEQEEFGDDVEDDLERYEMRSSTVIEVIQKNSVIGLFSPPNSLELFYLCKVLEFGIAKTRPDCFLQSLHHKRETLHHSILL